MLAPAKGAKINRSQNCERIFMWGARKLSFLGRPNLDYRRKSISMDARVAIQSGLGKSTHRQMVAPGNAAITVGIAAQSQTALLAATGLTAALQVVTPTAQPDVPRVIRLVCTKSGATAVGNGTYGAANSRYVIAIGTDITGNVITEWIALNDTTAVNSKKAFATLTSVTLPIKVNATGDTVSVGYGIALALERSISAATDMIECARKASAATAYTTETLGTLDVTQGNSTLSANIGATDTALSIVSGTPFTNGAQVTHATIIDSQGNFEDIIITSRTTTTLTVVRGADGTSARTWCKGCYVFIRPGQTYTPSSLTADDRFLLTYKTDVF